MPPVLALLSDPPIISEIILHCLSVYTKCTDMLHNLIDIDNTGWAKNRTIFDHPRQRTYHELSDFKLGMGVVIKAEEDWHGVGRP